MKRDFWTKSMLFSAAALLVTVVFVRCTKTGSTATQLDRSLAASTIDSTIFSPFYDTTVIPYANTPAGVNDRAITTGVQDIVVTNCSGANCHGGAKSPTLLTYAQIKALVSPGNPEQSQLWQLITTNDLSKAMPPVNMGNELSVTQKNVIYNWIQNGANETPTVVDYRPAAIHIIAAGCTSANCHSMPTNAGAWAKSGYLGALNATSGVDTQTVHYTAANSTALSSILEVVNPVLLASAWKGYIDSCYAYYPTISAMTASATAPVNAAYKSPRIGAALTSHGGFDTYDAIILDVNIPKGIRTSANTDYLNSRPFLYEIDSSVIPYYVRTGAAASKGGGMANTDGHFTSSEIAIVKAWYFLDPNIYDAWKFGIGANGLNYIFTYVNGGKPITKQ